MCGYFYFEINDLMLKGKSLLEYISLFSPVEYKNSDKIILKYVQYFIKRSKWKKSFVLFVVNIKRLNPNLSEGGNFTPLLVFP